MILVTKYNDPIKPRPMAAGTVSYKPVLTEGERLFINKHAEQLTDIFPGNKKECAHDACVNLARVVSTAGKKNIYEIFDENQKAGKLKKAPGMVFNEGPSSSWHSAGVFADADAANILYNAKINRPEDLDNVLKSPDVGTVVLLGTDNPLFQKNPNGYSKSRGFFPSNHTVMVYGYKPTGEPLFMDGYDKKIYDINDLNERWSGKYKIQTVYTPKEYVGLNKSYMENIYNQNLATSSKALSLDNNKPAIVDKKIYYNSGKYFKNLQNIQKEYHTGDMAVFFRALHDHAPDIAKDLYLNNADYARLANLAASIAIRESKGGKDTHGFFNELAEAHGDSKGLTQIKWTSLSPEVKNILLKKYGIASDYDFRISPEKTAIATMYHLGELINQVNSNYEKGVDKKTKLPSRVRGPLEVTKRKLRGKDADWYVEERTTEGNTPLSIEEKLLYGWGGLNRLKTGDAQGNNIYVKDVMDTYNKLNAGEPMFMKDVKQHLKKPAPGLIYKKK
jgi:hypothetical protein